MPNGNQNGNNERDRTVPPEEDFYGRYNVDLNFNSMEKNRERNYDEDGINPTTIYEDVYSGREKRLEIHNEDPPYRRQAPKKKKSGKRPFKIILAVFLAIVLLCVLAVEPALAKININEKTENVYVSESELKQSRNVKNILLLGVDARADEDGEASRADSIMLITIDKTSNKIKMTSFLRDSWIYIPCKDKKQRINAACSYGGYSAVVDTIEYNFKIDIDGYVVTDFEMFKVMVDSIGGVKIKVSEAEAEEVTNHPKRYGNVTLDSGEYTLSGEQALAYCRIRKIDTDWKRTERQRIVIEEIIKSLVKSGPVGAVKMINSIAPYIETDLSKSEIRSLAFSAAPAALGGFEQQTCPFEGTWEYTRKGGASVIGINVEENREKLQKFIYN